MDATLDRIKNDLDSLTQEQRAELATYLIHSLDPELDDENAGDVAAAWKVEIERRIRRIESGESRSRPAAEVLADLKARLR